MLPQKAYLQIDGFGYNEKFSIDQFQDASTWTDSTLWQSQLTAKWYQIYRDGTSVEVAFHKTEDNTTIKEFKEQLLVDNVDINSGSLAYPASPDLTDKNRNFAAAMTRTHNNYKTVIDNKRSE